MADAVHPDYVVTGQQKSTQPDQEGNFNEVWRVTFEANNGVRSYVDMPAEYYTAENVDAAIRAELHNIRHVAILGATPMPAAPAPHEPVPHQGPVAPLGRTPGPFHPRTIPKI